MINEPNEFRADLMSVSGMQPFPGSISNGRVCMFSNHISQRLVISGGDERRIQTGVEQDFAKYTLNVSMPADGRIIKVISKHKRTIGPDSIDFNPETLVIYQDAKTRVVGMFTLPTYCSYHQYLGFEYVAKPACSKLVPGQFIEGGTVFLDSPAVTDTGGYAYGINLNMAFMSMPGTSEDGIIICEDVLPRLKFKTYETRYVQWNNKYFPLNMYGTLEKFQAFPEIGEYIRKDQLLAVLRKFDVGLAAADQSIYDLMEPDLIFDKPVYAVGPKGKVVDIVVYHQDNGSDQTLLGMDTQIDRYDKAHKIFYKEIFDEYRRLYREHGAGLEITHEFHRMLVECQAMMDETSAKISKTIKHDPLDDYCIKFVIEFEITPDIGFKLTDCHGKAII